jgi:hypothetical protein
MYIGTTGVAINRGNAALTLAGITLVTPVLGVATATSINKVTITAPTTSATLTLVDGSSLITSGAYALTLTSGQATNVTILTVASLTMARIDAAQTFTGVQTFASFPITPFSAPTTDYQVANKLYVDDKVGSTSVASSATPSPVGSKKENEYYLTALAVAATFAAPSGTRVNGNTLLIRIEDNGIARELAWNAIYRVMSEALPLITVLGKIMYIGFIYNSTDSKWDCIGINQEA